MARIVFSVFIILCFLFLGEKKTRQLKDKLNFIEDYRKFVCELESAIRCVKKNMFEFFCFSNFKPPLIEHLITNKSKDINEAIKTFKSTQEEEQIVKIIAPALAFAQKSSDVKGISGALLHAQEMLCEYQNELKRELGGKIKTTPYLYFLVGVFVAVIII